jgi:hypothetical protein
MIKPTTKFRPRADAELARELFDRGWRARSDELHDAAELAHVQVVVRGRLLYLFPKADMAVLARYGAAKPILDISVGIRTPDSDRWGLWMRLQIGAPVTVPTSFRNLYAGGPVFWDEDGKRGLLPGAWEGMDEARRQELRDSWEASERGRVPQTVESYFIRLGEARHAHDAGMRGLYDFCALKGPRTWGDLYKLAPMVAEAQALAEV